MRAKKSLGQNFLTSGSALRAIVEAARLSAEDVVLEAGPGRGILTEKLLKTARRVVAVEKDESLVKFLRQKFSSEITSGKLELVSADILEFDPPNYQLETGNYKLVANIPYYITGEFLRKFLSGNAQPESLVLLLPKEVVGRIIAKGGKESILSISVKAYGEVKYIKTVPAGSFSPAPKVDSAIISIQNVSKKFFNEVSEEKFFAIVRAGFAHKRKLLIRNLEKLAGYAMSRQGLDIKESLKKTFSECNIPENARAEDIKPEQWKFLAQNLFSGLVYN